MMMYDGNDYLHDDDVADDVQHYCCGVVENFTYPYSTGGLEHIFPT